MQLFTKTTKRVNSVSRVYSPYKETKLYNMYKGELAISSLANYLGLTDDISQSPVVMIRNVYIGTDTIPFFKPLVEVDENYFKSLDTFRVFSYPNKPASLFNKWIEEPKNTCLVDIVNSKVNGYISVFDVRNVIIFKDYTYNSNWFIYFEKLLMTSVFKPKYEFILYPFTGNRLLPQIYMQFEQENNNQITYVVPIECKDDEYMTDWDLLINRPKLLFSVDKTTWKKWDFENNQWVNVNPDNGEYFTFDEFISKGMTYTEYLKIPDSAFSDSEDWYVMLNNYIPGFCLRPSYIEDFIGSTRLAKIDKDVFEDRLTIWTI